MDASAQNSTGDFEAGAVERIGVSLSGGGFRASAFHLGVLKRLEELGILQKMEALSTVSGGSITGALYALRCAEHGGRPGDYPVESLIDEMAPFLSRNLRARALFGTPSRALLALGSVFSKRLSRIGLIVRELDSQLFHDATLDRLPSWIVINATNLRTGKAWKFYADRAGDFLAGATDKTTSIRVSEAVAASAAYPLLTDSFAFVTRWEDLRGDLLSEGRWERPAGLRPGSVSRWRQRFGKPTGRVVFPLVDGGIYDNEGVNSLRGRRVTHAIISAVAPPESDSDRGFSPFRYLRLVEVMHDRLGNATRQLAHEMTHGLHPAVVRKESLAVAQELRELKRGTADAEAAKALEHLAGRVEDLASVGLPPRTHQFTASAQILLHRTDLAANAYRSTPGVELDVPIDCRGLSGALTNELARVRTDLDALEPNVSELLMAQGYFLTDLQVKLAMPDLLPKGRTLGWYDSELVPQWYRAHAACSNALANAEHTRSLLQDAQLMRAVIGREPNRIACLVFWSNFIFVTLVLAVAVVTGVGMLHAAWHVLHR